MGYLEEVEIEEKAKRAERTRIKVWEERAKSMEEDKNFRSGEWITCCANYHQKLCYSMAALLKCSNVGICASGQILSSY